MREDNAGTETLDETPPTDSEAEAPELTPREVAKEFAENARAYVQQGRELTNRLRATEGELARARAALGTAIADATGPEAEAELHDRITRASETVTGIKAALVEVEKRADAFRSGEKHERLKAAIADEDDMLAVARSGEDNAHALLVDFVHELLGPIVSDARRAGQRANTARGEAKVIRAQLQPGAVEQFGHAWEGFRRYPDLERVVRTLLDYAGNRTIAQQNVTGAQTLLRMSQLHRDAMKLQDEQDAIEARAMLGRDPKLQETARKESPRAAFLEALAMIDARRMSPPQNETRGAPSGGSIDTVPNFTA